MVEPEQHADFDDLDILNEPMSDDDYYNNLIRELITEG